MAESASQSHDLFGDPVDVIDIHLGPDRRNLIAPNLRNLGWSGPHTTKQGTNGMAMAAAGLPGIKMPPRLQRPGRHSSMQALNA